MSLREQSISLGELASLLQCELRGDAAVRIEGINDLAAASGKEVAFLENRRYLSALKETRAAAVILDPAVLEEMGGLQLGRNYLLSQRPSYDFQKVIDFFFPVRGLVTGFLGIHPTAVIHSSARLAEGVQVGAHTVIDQDVTVGVGTAIGACVYIGVGTSIGRACIIHPGVVIRERCQVGNEVILQPGAVVGSCGYGYYTNSQGHHEKLQHVGQVVLEDRVEIGAHTAIDRGRFGKTVVGLGSKIDNLVQIAHNVILGAHNLVVAQAGIAGSSSTGDWVVLGGQAGVAGHLRLASSVRVAAKAGVSKSLLQPGDYGGMPAVPLAEHQRMQAVLKKMVAAFENIPGKR